MPSPDVPRHLDVPSFGVYLVVLIAVTMMTRYRPSYGLFAMICADPFDFSRHLSLTTITIPKVVLLGVLAGLLTRRRSLRVLRDRPIRDIAAACAAILIATALTAIPGLYIDAVARETLKALEYLALFSVAALAYTADPDENLAWIAIALGVSVTSLLAFGQEFANAPSSAYVAARVIPRIAGPLEGPNQLAGYLDVGFAMLLARFAVRRTWATGGALVIGALADVLTLSRAGALGICFGAVAVIARVADRRTRVVVVTGFVGALAVAVGLLARLGALGRTFSIDDVDYHTGLGTRADLWSAAGHFFLTHPVLGIGAGNFELMLPSIGLLGVRTHANSLYLQSLAEGGLVLFAATIVAMVTAVRTLYLSRGYDSFAIGAGAATIALAIHQTLDDLTFFPKVGGFWWICLAIAAASVATRKTASERAD